QVPIGEIDVKLKGGPRGVLAMPQECGKITTKAALTPWSGGADAVSNTETDVTGCGKKFEPKLNAGMDEAGARRHGTFVFRFTREDGEPWLRGLTARLPEGLLASVRGVPLCSNAQAD